jgi:inosine-uridine nucleoside N-ribohydrolase
MNEPLIGAQCLSSLFPNIPVASGNSTETPPPQAAPAWLTQFRNSFQELAKKQGFVHTKQAIRDSTADKVKDLLQNVPEETTVDLLCLGPLTNLAHWIAKGVLSLEDETCKIGSVWIMGGNDCWSDDDPVTMIHRRKEGSNKSSSTIGSAGGGTIEPEFNFQQDPAAVRDVLTCPALQGKLHLVTTRCTVDDKKDDCAREKAFQELQAKCRNLHHGGDSSSSSSSSTLLVADLVASMPRKHLYDPVCAFAYVMPQHVQMMKRQFCVSTETALLIPVSTAAASKSSGPVVEALVPEDFDFHAFCLWIENGLC